MFCAKLESKPSFLKVLSRMIRIYAGIYILRGINYVTYLVPAFVKLEVNGSEIFTKLQKKKSIYAYGESNSGQNLGRVLCYHYTTCVSCVEKLLDLQLIKDERSNA